MNHIMIDLETWDTTDNSVIRALAMAKFHPTTGDISARLVIDARPSVDNQVEVGRSISEQTQAFWRRQPFSLSKFLNETPREYLQTCNSTAMLRSRIADFVRPTLQTDEGKPSDGRIWSRGSFDCGILRDLLIDYPWRYWQERDVRTLDSLVDKVTPSQPHNPLSDVEAQIQQVRNAHALAGITLPDMSQAA